MVNKKHEITRDFALMVFRQSSRTIRDFLESDDPDCQKIASFICDTPVRELSGLGGPAPMISEKDTPDLRMKIARAMVDPKTGSILESSTGDLLARLGGDVQDQKNYQAMIRLMIKSEEDKGYGDFIHTSGQKRGAAYLLSDNAIQRLLKLDINNLPPVIEKVRAAPVTKSSVSAEILNRFV